MLRIDKSGAWLGLANAARRPPQTGEPGPVGADVGDMLPEELRSLLGKMLRTALASRQDQLRECDMVVDDDIRHYEMAVFPLGGDEAVAHDVSDRKKFEERMLQVQRIESFGRFAGGAAHDFNNLLTAILGYCQMATRAKGRVDTLQTSLREIEKAAQRGAELCRQLLLFAGRQRPETQIVSLNDLVQGTAGMLRRLIGADIELVMDLQADIGLIAVDPAQFEQVVVNLVSNASDAIPVGGTITIETANVDRATPAGLSGLRTGTRHGDSVMLSVRDTGMGISPEVVHRVFEPFYTGKEYGEGTGLGLFICNAIVMDHGGVIDVHSEQNKVTTFEVYLPRVPVPEVQDSDRGQGRAPHGNETVLLVEDDQDVREVAADVLRHHGYTVLEAGDGVEALYVVESRNDRQVDLLFTDVVMPLMNGRELATRLRDVLPEFKVLYTSGYTWEAINRMGRADPGGAFLEKPFTSGQLAQKIRAVLES